MKEPLFRSQILKRIILATVLLSLASGGFAAPPVAPDPAAGKDRTDAETRAMVLEKLKVGVNTDFTFTGSSAANKVLYEPAYLDAVAAAGFKSVRIFCGYSRESPAIFEKVIKDAIARDLVIVFLNFGDMRGKDAFVKTWREIAEYYKDYPAHLVFEILNEPAFGSQIKNDDEVPEWYNAVIPVIRQSNPKRILLLGGPHHNEIDRGVKYLTPEYLTYRLPDGKGFVEDEDIFGAFHHYKPGGLTIPKGKYVRLRQFPNWQREISSGLDRVVDWSARLKKPAVITEWGAYTCTMDRAEWITYTRYFHDQLKQRGIGSMYYTAFFANDWAWSIYDSEWGWDQAALDILTGVKSPAIPPTNPLVNPEFNAFSHRWSATSIRRDTVVKEHGVGSPIDAKNPEFVAVPLSVAKNAGLSGPNALKIDLPKDLQGVAIHTGSKYEYPKGVRPIVPLSAETPQASRTVLDGALKNYEKFLLHLRRGNTYRVTFLARAEKAGVYVKARFDKGPGNGLVYWDSNAVKLETATREYAFEYIHDGDDLADLRLTVMFIGSDNTVYFDRVALKSTRNE